MSEKLKAAYINLAGQEPDDTTMMIIRGCNDPENWEWQETGAPNFPYALVRIEEDDPFAPPKEHTNFGVDSQPEDIEFEYDEFSVPNEPSTATLKQIVPTGAAESYSVMKSILSSDDRDKLLVNHNETARSARHILDGFTIERLIEAYAEGLSNEEVSRYLRIKPSQLQGWLAMSQQRMAIVSRLKDIMRSQRVDHAIDESLDYEVEMVYDKADEAYERLKLEAMKMRSKTAMELDKRSRGQDNADGGSLPVVNLGLQVNMNTVGGKALDSVQPVLPGMNVIDH